MSKILLLKAINLFHVSVADQVYHVRKYLPVWLFCKFQFGITTACVLCRSYFFNRSNVSYDNKLAKNKIQFHEYLFLLLISCLLDIWFCHLVLYSLPSHKMSWKRSSKSINLINILIIILILFVLLFIIFDKRFKYGPPQKGCVKRIKTVTVVRYSAVYRNWLKKS